MPFKWDAPYLDQAAIRANLNTDAMPYVIANACLTAKFSEDESIGETWQRTPNGAIAYWGGVSYTFWEPDDILEKNFYDAIFRLKKTRFGDMMHHGIKKHWEHFGGAGFSRYYWEVSELFGDPSIHFQASPIVGK